MAQQRETKLVGLPFDNHLMKLGWTVDNVHGNQFQMGFPDKYIHHSNWSARWVEYKVFDEYGHIKLTDAQRANFPVWISHKIPIYIIASDDLRGLDNFHKRKRLYKKLFEEPNAHLALDRRMHALLK